MLYLENAKEFFASAGEIRGSVNSEARFYHELAKLLPDKVDVDTLILALKVAFRDAEKGTDNVAAFIALVPHYVRTGASKEFSQEFRKKYNAEVLGLSQEELPDVDYGYVEVEPDVIDISSKDRAEVLAALYNASTPIGMGFLQYNPMPWTKEIAEAYFEHYAEVDVSGAISFKWILGRPVHCTFIGNLVYVEAYNYDNDYGLAQKAISTCPNKTLKKVK